MSLDANTLEHVRATLIDLAIRFGPKLVVGILILIAGIVVGRAAARRVGARLHKLDMEPPIRQLFTRVVHVLVVGLFAIMALQNLGVDVLPLIAGLGVIGAGIALATQGVLSNLVAGLTIIFTKPYRVGEYIAVIGVEGRVDAIRLFSTQLMHADRSRVVIPNRKIVGEILHNYGRIRQCELRVGLAYDTDVPRALALIGAVVCADARVLKEPAPLIQVAQLGDSAIGIDVRPWVAMEDFYTAPGELNAALLAALQAQRIEIPFQQLEVRLLGGEAAAGRSRITATGSAAEKNL